MNVTRRILRSAAEIHWSGWLLGLLVGVLLGACVPGSSAENMIGRQSQNEGMLVVPAPGKVAIDGDLKDWDWSGRIWVFADTAVRDRYSVEASGMWDKEYLYLAAKWKDPAPMFSLIDPAFNPDEGWKEDSWQMRVTTADRTLWLTTWYYTTQKQPVLHIAYWKNARDMREGQTITLLTAPPGGTVLGQGAEMAYKADADGKGFVQELKIPWKLLFVNVPEIKPGLAIRIGSEFLWGDPTGKTWPVHRYADNMQPGKTSREFFWSARDVWGDAKLVDKGNVPMREYRADTGRIDGTIPVRVTIPDDAQRFTIVIEDAQGRRVRNLAGDCDPADYRVSAKAKKGWQTVEVKWDGLDDKGKLAAPGAYTVRGLTHKGISADYEMCFYCPGTPPWDTKDGRGAWGADHTAPIGVAAGGDWTVVTWPVVEGGCGIIGIDPTGQKRWGDRRGITKVTADGEYAYGYVTSWYTGETLCRFSLKTGVTMPFVVDGKPRTFDLPLTEIFGTEQPGKISGLAVNKATLAVALRSPLPQDAVGLVTSRLALLDAGSAQVRKSVTVFGTLGEIAFSRDGKLYGLIDGKLCRFNLETGEPTVIPTPGLATPVALAVDGDGNAVIADVGPDSQVKAFSPDGKLVYTCGKKGGRPIRGAFDEQAMLRMSSVAVDSQGRVWVVENWNFPRRVSVWGKDGKLIRDYLGNTGYAGADCYLHEQEPTLAYCGPMEFTLNKAAGTWKLTRILWVPDASKGESFTLDTGSNVIPQRFTSAASGKPREYLFSHEPGLEWGTGNVVFMERGGKWQPVAAICLAGHISGQYSHDGKVLVEPSGEMAGLNAYDAVIWNDTNKDGKVQRVECTVILTPQPGSATRNGRPAIDLANGWGGRIGNDMSIYTDGLVRYRPLGFTEDGAPIYGLNGRYPLGVTDNGDLVPVPGEDRLLSLSFAGYAGPTKLTGIDLQSNTLSWYYANPYPGVHGSHNATMPKPGLLIGPLKIAGVAHIDEQIGNVFMLRGNLGQDFFLTTDGLFVGALFQDGRLPYEALPDTEAQLKGMPMEGFSEGGEPFNGWFGKQADGKIRLTTGMARQAGMILQLKGLESIRRFSGGTLKVDQLLLARAETDNAGRAQAATAAKKYTVKRLATPPALDGNAAAWKDVPAVTVTHEGQVEKAIIRLAYDTTNLYARYEVTDTSPWRNEGRDFTRLYKTGDAVDLQLGPAGKAHTDPQVGDQRIVFATFNGKPVAVLMRPIDKTAPASMKMRLASPVGTKGFDRVEVLADARVEVKVNGSQVIVEAAIPLATLDLAPQSGLALRGDLGFISSDAQGMINTARTYWANPHTNLVNDLPMEAWLYPNTWGEIVLE